MKINQLNRTRSVSGGDLVPIYTAANGDTQAAAISQIADYVIDNIPESTSDIVSLSTFGAFGNGIVDDTQSFLDAAASNKSVFVPKPAVGYVLSADVLNGNLYSTDTINFVGNYAARVRYITSPNRLPRKQNFAAMTWHYNAGSEIVSRTDSTTYGLKFDVEANFDSVALMWINNNPAIVAGCKAVVAMTETFDQSTQANRYQPVVGGVTYNALRNSTDNYGWDAVTWGGAATIDLPASAGIATPSISVSDFMNISSVPRADGGLYPLLLLRGYISGGVNPYTAWERGFTNLRVAGDYNRGRLIDVGVFGGDAIAALGSVMSAGVSRMAMLSPLFRFKSNVVSIACVGDSISSGGITTTGVGGWLKRACYDLSTSNNPVIPTNQGYYSQTVLNYESAAKIVLAQQKPNICFYSPYSPNTAPDTVRKYNDMIAKMDDFINFCNTNDIIPILWTPVPWNAISVTQEIYRQLTISMLRDLATYGNLIVADFAAVTGDTASPQQWLTGLNIDALHPNDTGSEVMSKPAKKAILKAMYGY